MVIAFDLDDTLYKEADYASSAYMEVAKVAEKRFGADGKEAYRAMRDALEHHENPFTALEQVASVALPIPELVEIYRQHFPDISLDATVWQTLDVLEKMGHRLCLVTDGRSSTQRHKIEALALRRFISPEAIFISEETGADKRLADNFVSVERLFPGDRYVYVGDNPAKDFFHPNRMGWLTVCLKDDGRNIHPQENFGWERQAQIMVDSLAELPEIIEKFEKTEDMADKQKVALITGITGQDGSFLAEFLLDKGYEVHGIIRRSSSFNTGRIEHLYFDEWVRDMHRRRLINLHYGDMTDSSSLIRLIQELQPDEIYNLAAQSHVKVSFEVPEYTADTDAVGTLRLLEAVRMLGLGDKTRIYQASTSELFGKVQEIPQRETTPFYPRSPYGCAKLYGFWITKNYRESYGMYAVNGILFNHESERRGENFVTRKITLAVARIAAGLQDKLYLGNLNARRDWGYARDYVECMWLMLQQEEPQDYVIATGDDHSVREFTTLAFQRAGISLRWEGEGVSEKGVDEATGRVLVEVDPKYFRPCEVEQLLGDPTKARTELGWNPRKTTFEELVNIMTDHDMQMIRCHQHDSDRQI